MGDVDGYIVYIVLFVQVLSTKRNHTTLVQGSKITLVRSYLRVPQAAGQVKILLFLVKIKVFPMYVNIFCDAGQVPFLRYFKACVLVKFLKDMYTLYLI